MPGNNAILHLVMVIIFMILITFTFLSGKFFQKNNIKYFLIFSSGILFLSFISLEAVLEIYLVKFYLYFGWSAILLFAALFLILVSPFVLNIYKFIQHIIPAARTTKGTIPQAVAVIQPVEIKAPQPEIKAPQPEIKTPQPGIIIPEPEIKVQQPEAIILLPEATITKTEETSQTIIEPLTQSEAKEKPATKPVRKTKASTVKKTTTKSKTPAKSTKTKGKKNAKH